jgi:diketogulonate reductase-like aldo/keto reductase
MMGELMAKYRKKPVVIEAIPCIEIIYAMEYQWEALPKWVKDAYEEGVITAIGWHNFTVNTLEGPLTALRGDMLIKGVAGELYPCRDSIFVATYDLVAE